MTVWSFIFSFQKKKQIQQQHHRYGRQYDK